MRARTALSSFERISKRHKGFPSEARVKRSRKGHLRTITGGEIEPVEKLGRNDPCPCGSGKAFKRCCLRSGRFRRVGASMMRPGFAHPYLARKREGLETPSLIEAHLTSPLALAGGAEGGSVETTLFARQR